MGGQKSVKESRAESPSGDQWWRVKYQGPSVSVSSSRAATQAAATGIMRSFWGILIMVTIIDASCKFEGKEICEGAVTRELSTVVKICDNGKLKLKKKSDIAPGWPMAGGECVWYGEVLCDGAVVQDLYRWWFLMKCTKGRMSLYSRSWSEVSNDPRYKNRYNNRL